MRAVSKGHGVHFRLKTTVCLFALGLALAGCASGGNLTTGSIPRTRGDLSHMTADQVAGAADRVGAVYAKNPKDRDTGLTYAQLLSMAGRTDQALAVMQQVAIAHPDDREVLGALGKAQAAAGQLQPALDTIHRAQTPDMPDWKLMSAEAAILDQLGRPEEARNLYRKALERQPNEPSVLSNLGMSYLLAGDLRSAETYMRQAAQQPTADSRVRQNLALVVGLQGRFDEADKIARAELSPAQAEANVAYLKAMLSQQNSWRKLAAEDKGGKPQTATN